MAHKISAKSHAELVELHKVAETAYDAYKAKLEEEREAAQDHYDARSERWQESEKGESYKSWLDDLTAAVDAMDFTLPDVPDREPS